MKILHILKTEPDHKTNVLIKILSEGKETSEFCLFADQADYGKLIDMIFEHDKVISWW